MRQLGISIWVVVDTLYLDVYAYVNSRLHAWIHVVWIYFMETACQYWLNSYKEEPCHMLLHEDSYYRYNIMKSIWA